MAAENSVDALFKDVRYYNIGAVDEKIEKLLTNGKAKQESYLSGLATHAIVTDYSNLEVEEARDVWQIPAVTVKWVELSLRCKKLLPTEPFTPSNSRLFSGLVVCPSQLNKADKNLLWAIVTFYGGSCQLVLNKICTHLVLSTPSGSKYDEAIKHPGSIGVVTLDWILDSVKAKVLQDIKKYHPSLVETPQEKQGNEAVMTVVPDTQASESDKISSSLQSLSVAPSVMDKAKTSTTYTTKASTIQDETSLSQSLISQVAPLAPVLQQTPMHTGQVSQPISSSVHPHSTMVQTGMAFTQSDKGGAHPLGQSVTSQPGQQFILAGQPNQQQMMAVQQFQMQRQMTPGSSARFAVGNLPQRFSGPNQSGQQQRQPSPSTKKTPQKRRRSSTKSKANTTSTATVPSSPVPVNQMTMTQQQFLQQQNQQMLIKHHRMSMMQQQAGQPAKVNFMQPQQMYQQQHFANMQGKSQVPPASPQKQGLHIVGEQQVPGGMRPGFPGNFAGNGMRMQQHQMRPMTVQTQMPNQQMMTMGFNPQIQMQQQQVKMSAPGQQQQAQVQFHQQQQGVLITRGMQMQNQHQVMGSGKMQPQRMQISPQQQAMFASQHINKDGGPSHQTLQQHSPMKQQPQTGAQQPQTPMTPQQRQQQIVMQQMAQRQLQMQQQQQLMQTPGSLQAQQKHTPPPTSHAPINVGIGVISPTALQQGLMMAQAQQNFQPPLIHPSLQAPQDYGKVTQQSGSTKSRRSKSRKPKDGDENTEGKPKSKPRSRPKKSSQSPASATSPGAKKLSQNSPAVGGITGYYQTPLNVMTPPPHPTVPVALSINKQGFASPTATVSPLVATENTFGPSQLVPNSTRIVQSSHITSKFETHYLPQRPQTPTPPPPHRGPFNDPLELLPKTYEGNYHGHDPWENVPQDLCLLGCVFVIIEYQETVPDKKIIEHWKKVINKFGGIVEDEYNTCTCTHLLCISQSTTLFRDSLLEGKRCVTVYWLNDVLQIRSLKPPWLAIHVPTPYPTTKKPATNHTISYTSFHQKERERLRMMASVCGCKFSGFLSRSNTVLVCKGTLSLKYDKAREWRIPCVNVHWLRDVMQGDPDALNDPSQSKYQNFDENATDLFTVDESKTQKILEPWKVPVRVTLDCMQRARVKRKNSVSDAANPALKRSRVEGSYQPLPRVCFTGLPTKQVADLQKTLESLQGQTSKTISLSTHLVANSVSRTVKFLCAISVCQYIVTPEWIEESGKSNWLLDEDKYLLYDKKAEEKFDFSLKESVSRARKRPLFKGYVFCITENVVPDRKILTEIVECAGGKVIEKIPIISVLKRLKARKPPNNHLMLVSCPADEEQVIKWKREGIPVHNAEIILSGVLKQEVNETSYQL